MTERKKQKSSVVTVILFALAVLLLLFGTVGGIRAALTYFSQTYSSRLSTLNIGITLNENGVPVGRRDYDSDGKWKEETGELLTNMLSEGEELVVGKAYDEALTVTNSGSIDEYVRVTIYKYWMDQNGKRTNLSPDLIHLNLTNDGWIRDDLYSTKANDSRYKERTVLYYTKPLAVGETTTALSDKLSIDSSIGTKVRQETKTENGYTTITTIYDYDGVQFCVEAEADGVQTHNAKDAILSAWGRNVEISDDGTLSLVKEGE
ncbi:MAG: hypothetical protein IKS19_07270 [Clostridia bacterium]|nr:hypothetical protein [Clostridia bacterium]